LLRRAKHVAGVGGAGGRQNLHGPRQDPDLNLETNSDSK
jgi:hypothetical protein